MLTFLICVLLSVKADTICNISVYVNIFFSHAFMYPLCTLVEDIKDMAGVTVEPRHISA